MKSDDSDLSRFGSIPTPQKIEFERGRRIRNNFSLLCFFGVTAAVYSPIEILTSFHACGAVIPFCIIDGTCVDNLLYFFSFLVVLGVLLIRSIRYRGRYVGYFATLLFSFLIMSVLLGSQLIVRNRTTNVVCPIQ
jgi:hypothetical protein